MMNLGYYIGICVTMIILFLFLSIQLDMLFKRIDKLEKMLKKIEEQGEDKCGR